MSCGSGSQFLMPAQNFQPVRPAILNQQKPFLVFLSIRKTNSADLYDTTIFTGSGVKAFATPACFGFSVMSLLRSASESFLASSPVRLGILAAGLPAASAPWQAAHFAL